MDRVRPAIAIPFVVFIVVAGVAVAIGTFLHQVRDIAEASAPKEIAQFATPVAALLLVLIITAAGFIASASAGHPES